MIIIDPANVERIRAEMEGVVKSMFLRAFPSSVADTRASRKRESRALLRMGSPASHWLD